MRSLTSVGGVGGAGINNSNRNTPSRCDNLSTVSGASTSSPRPDLASKSPPPPPHPTTSTIITRPQQNKLHPQKHLLQKPPPDSSRPRRNIRPSISPAIRNPATSAHQTQSTSATAAATSNSASTSSSSSPAAAAVTAAASRKPHQACRRSATYRRRCHWPTNDNRAQTHHSCIHYHQNNHHHLLLQLQPKHNNIVTFTSHDINTDTGTASTTTLIRRLETTAARPVLQLAHTPPQPRPKCPEPLSPYQRRASEAVAHPVTHILSVRFRILYTHHAPLRERGSTTTRQPAMPSLSAKAMGRTPLTPKVAAKPSPAVTPLGRRRNDNPNNNNHHPLPHTNGGGARDDLTSPAPFLAATNVTPRSGSRQSRVNSANTTPNGTPNPDRNEWDHQPTLEPPRRQVVTFSPPSSVGSRNDAPESKFFYASEAKPSQPAPQPKAQPKPMAPAQRGSTFMYANGSAVETSRPTSPGVGFTPVLAPSLAPSLSPSLAPTAEPPSSKFFYANGAPNLQPGFRPASAASGTGSVASGSSRLHRTSAGSASGFQMAQRPLSPNKPAQAPTSAPLLKSNSMPPHTVGRSQMTSPPPLVASHKRRTSTDTVSQVASYVGAEAPATDAMIMSRFMASQTSTPSEMPSPTAPSFFPQQPITIASIIQAADDLEDEDEDEDSADESKDLDDPHSPTKSSPGDPLNDMVLNARRERKVQDLEITNASLEAINRSLERQLRKQTAELRRYKRLSRSGRLSAPTSAASSRVSSETQPGGLGIDGLDLSDLSEDEAEDDLEEMDDSMFESSELSETDSTSHASPRQDTDRYVRRRTRDEKRLRLDLSKHRELLVDSQKINQSIKRCLNWTEELIKEGKKALEYNVRPSDVELPPRVLRPAYLEEDEGRGQRNEFSVSLPSSPVESTRSLSPHWSKEPQDRDSGIELPADSR
ncbi:uncharacterized protein ColSpa_01682 [Colletotrichum spaethianum]|uniref:Uncharacterized protein n=1 Tax=Colletotrichum spaethianum TaxID=700344 RepID=A0AA37L3V6_9PEZI|nr:uncharacterized protein ColSpa_01682 [Colletotrichum spaethianum]GKT41501.1 hypothetical protein ColSpa_01682 [Colletotrichum spaethianum]